MRPFAIAVLASYLLSPPAGAQDQAAPPPTASAEPFPLAVDDRIKALEERLNALERAQSAAPGAPARTALSAFNPAMGVLLDSLFTSDNDKANVQFRTAEINLGAAVDPFLKGGAVINANAAEVEVEEAWVRTTALPWSLTVTGGRLFASFGRMPHFHDDSLPTPFRPASIDSFMNGETRADGVEVSYLFPTPFYLSATLGSYNGIGAENGRFANARARSLDQFTYMGRMAATAEFGDDHSVDLGLSEAWTPKRFVLDTSVAGTDFNADGIPDTPNETAGIETRKNTWRTLTGVDMTYRYHPASGGLYTGAVWGTEVLMNDERRFNPATNLPRDRVRAFSGYSYLQAKLGRRWRPGVLVDLTEDLDNPHRLTSTYAAFLTHDVTEFQRLRLAYSTAIVNEAGRPRNHALTLQWTAVLGFHLHGFPDR